MATKVVQSNLVADANIPSKSRMKGVYRVPNVMKLTSKLVETAFMFGNSSSSSQGKRAVEKKRKSKRKVLSAKRSIVRNKLVTWSFAHGDC